uniref:Uncharacterized protein n=1 Tax=Oryza glumipatula TaxID=40148 RepID=A0A0D9YMG0_9ORYZ
MCPSRLLEGSETSVTVLSGLQVIPSHSQQSTPSFHDMLRPPSLESPVRKLREFFSCSVHELVGEVKLSSSTRARLRTACLNSLDLTSFLFPLTDLFAQLKDAYLLVQHQLEKSFGQNRNSIGDTR